MPTLISFTLIHSHSQLVQQALNACGYELEYFHEPNSSYVDVSKFLHFVNEHWKFNLLVTLILLLALVVKPKPSSPQSEHTIMSCITGAILAHEVLYAVAIYALG